MNQTTKEIKEPTTRVLTAFEQKEVVKMLMDFEEKYESLVWFARKPPASDTEYWDKIPSNIRTGAMNAASRVAEFYPNETESLKCPECGDWSHGFHSGVLAGVRLAMTALTPTLIEEDLEDGEEPFWMGGVEDATEMFPELST